MKNNNEIVALALVFLLGSLAGQAGAANATMTYMVGAAPVDQQVYAGDGGHALWFSNDSHDYVFTTSPGALIEYDDGTASLEGVVKSNNSPNRGFQISLQLDGRTSIATPGSPKKELRDSAYIESGGTVDTNSWYYYSGFVGTLTGVGELAGVVLAITQRGPAFQIGYGANNKNLNYGASAWFDAEDAEGNLLRGDFNIELTAVPVPAALQLMLSAIAALSLATRRRKS